MEVIVPSDGCRLWFLAASPADHSWDRARRVKPTLSGAHFLIVRAVSARLSIILTGGGGRPRLRSYGSQCRDSGSPDPVWRVRSWCVRRDIVMVKPETLSEEGLREII